MRILERADAILSSDAVWNRADTRECPAGETTFSLFCALHDACVEVLGHYEHRRAALQEVRFVIDERVRKDYEHQAPRYGLSDLRGGVLGRFGGRSDCR